MKKSFWGIAASLLLAILALFALVGCNQEQDDPALEEVAGTYSLYAAKANGTTAPVNSLFSYAELTLDKRGNFSGKMKPTGEEEELTNGKYTYEERKVTLISSEDESDVETMSYSNGILKWETTMDGVKIKLIFKKADYEFGDPVVVGRYEMYSISGQIYGTPLTVDMYEYYRMIFNADGTFSVQSKGTTGATVEINGTYTYDYDGVISASTKNNGIMVTEEYQYSSGKITYSQKSTGVSITIRLKRVETAAE